MRWMTVTVNDAFECDAITGEIRPEGGDYFSVIRLHLDSGTVLYFCSADTAI